MIEVEVEDEAWSTALPEVEALVIRAAEAALSSPVFGGGGPAKQVEGASDARSPSVVSLRSPTPPPDEGEEGEITVLLTSDEAVRDLNARFRKKDSATNVLSFPAADSARPYLGDVALAYGVCAAEAQAQGKPLAHHLMHLTVHGVLHLLGYDHLTDAEAKAMEALEADLLAGLGVPDPYAPEANA